MTLNYIETEDIVTASVSNPLIHNVRMLCVCVCHRGKPASRLAGDVWSKSISLILKYLEVFLDFCGLNDFF